MLLLGELALAVGFGWLWQQEQALADLAQLRHQVHQATDTTTARIHDRRRKAEDQLHQVEEDRW